MLSKTLLLALASMAQLGSTADFILHNACVSPASVSEFIGDKSAGTFQLLARSRFREEIVLDNEEATDSGKLRNFTITIQSPIIDPDHPKPFISAQYQVLGPWVHFSAFDHGRSFPLQKMNVSSADGTCKEEVLETPEKPFPGLSKSCLPYDQDFTFTLCGS